LLLATGAVHAQVYKWLDEQGQVHYGGHVPAGSDAQELKLPPGPTHQEVDQSERALKRLLEQQKRAQEIETRAKERQSRREQREASERDQRCTAARRNLRILGIQRPVYWTGADGSRIYLDDNSRAQLTARLKEEVEANCQ
jgi:hypothetical protein